MRLTQQLITTSLILIISLAGISEALEYSSYIFTTDDIIFFSYEDGTEVELYDSSGNPITVNPNVLDKGEHTIVDDGISQGVYMVAGSNKFAVLTGDPTVSPPSGGVSGYYAMDANGLGTSTEFYTYVPAEADRSGHQLFIVFAYEPNTSVTVQAEDVSGVYQDVDTFSLNKGQHWATANLSDEYLHIIADKPVSALTCYDQGYFVPSANGRWSGTEFYTYVSDIGESNSPWLQDLTVIAYDNDTSVTIKDTNDPNIVIWSGTLNNGQAYVVKCPEDPNANLNTYYTIESSKTVTVSVQPWESYSSEYHQGVFIPDREGTGIGRTGRDLIGSTLSGGYLYILAHTDDTHVDLYNSENGSWIDSYALNEGGAVNAEPGNGLWRIISDRYVSAYSGWGNCTAEFAPLAFDAKPGLLYLNKIAAFEGTCVLPGDEITYTITYGPNGFDHNEVVITDYLPEGVEPNNPFDPNYDPNRHTYTWQIGPLDANDPNDSVTLKVRVNGLAEPLGTLINRCEIESDIAYSTAEVNTPVCCWGGDIIYVDKWANGSNSGTSWSNAYTELQSALERARKGCGSQIWVAQGTYKPTDEHGDREATFELVGGLPMYGGFAGTETTLDQRDWMTNETVLSGDIDGGGRDSDDVWHVVTALDVNEATIDGFIITMGWDAGIYSNGGSLNIQQNKISENRDGIFCEDSNSNIANCLIEHNTACGIQCRGTSSVTIANNQIMNNTYSGIYSETPSILLIKNNWIHHNQQYGICRDCFTIDSEALIRNNTIVDNAWYGVGAGNAELNITNCVIWDNGYGSLDPDWYGSYNVTYSCIEGGYDGEGNIDTDPCFVDDPNDPNNYHLSYDSDCNNAGDPNLVLDDPNETDIDGEPRAMGDCNEIVDMGADEVYFPNCWNCDCQCHGDADCDCNVTGSDFLAMKDAWFECYRDPNYNPCADFDRDGCVKGSDFLILKEYWFDPNVPHDCNCCGEDPNCVGWPPDQGRGGGGEGQGKSGYYLDPEDELLLIDMIEWLEIYKPPEWQEFIWRL